MEKDNAAQTTRRRSRLVLAVGAAILLLGFVPGGWYVAVLIALVAMLTISVSRKDAAGIILALGASYVMMHANVGWHVRVVNTWREQARRLHCRRNLDNIAKALRTYSAQNDEFLPPDLQTLVTQKYVQDENAFACPSTTHDPRAGQSVDDYGAYLYFGGGARFGDAAAVLVADRPGNHGDDGRNVVQGDGRVSWQPTPPEGD